jgi:group I intron endonuclease
MPRKEKSFHLLYKTTNLITNQYYVGIHSTDDPFDGYLGSGKRLLRSVAKYGRDAHNVEYLDIFKCRNDLIEAEKGMVNRKFLSDPMCMNINVGGVAKPLNLGVSLSTREKLSKAHKGRKVTWGDKISKSRQGIKFSDTHKENISKAQCGRLLTEEWKSNIGKASKNARKFTRAVVVAGVEYESCYVASAATGIKNSTIGKRILSKNYKDYFYKDTPKDIEVVSITDSTAS